MAEAAFHGGGRVPDLLLGAVVCAACPVADSLRGILCLFTRLCHVVFEILRGAAQLLPGAVEEFSGFLPRLFQRAVDLFDPRFEPVFELLAGIGEILFELAEGERVISLVVAVGGSRFGGRKIAGEGVVCGFRTLRRIETEIEQIVIGGLIFGRAALPRQGSDPGRRGCRGTRHRAGGGAE